MGLLEVGLEEEGDVTMGTVPLGDLGRQLGQPCAGPGAPLLGGPGEHGERHRAVPRHHAPVEQSQLGAQVLPGHLQDLARAAHGVVEADALVPHRVPDGVGQGRDVTAAVVHQHHVEIAVGAQLAPAVSAHRHQRHPVGIAPRGLVQQPGQPAVGGVGQGPAEGVTVQVGRSSSSWRNERRDTGDGSTGTPDAPAT